MEGTTLVISIVALILAVLLAGFGILLQWLVSKDTRQQATEIRKDVGDFKSEVTLLLGEIRGLTTQTRESQERQVDTMLRALVDRTREATTSEAKGVFERIDAIEASVREDREPSEQLAVELHQLRDKVEALVLEIPSAVQRARPRVGGPRIGRVHVSPPEVKPGGQVQIVLDCSGDVEGLVAACGVATPEGLAWGSKRAVDREREGVGMGHTFVSFRYPQDFQGAHSEAPGGYWVRSELRWPDIDAPPIDEEFSQFRVPDFSG